MPANATRTYIPLSGSPDGRGIPIESISEVTPTLIHLNPQGSKVQHKLRLFASNSQDATNRPLYLYFGKPDDVCQVTVTIPAQQGLFAVVPELTIGPNDEEDLGVWAFVDSGNEGYVSIFGTYDVADANIPG
jgi:hypothetical protein